MLIACDALGLDDGPGTAGDAVPGTIRVSDLPPEARETLGLIDSGGPFPFRKDGDVFHNYEGRCRQRKTVTTVSIPW